MRGNISALILLKLSLFLILLFTVTAMRAQDSTEKKTAPPFRILLTNMKYFTAGDMEKNKTAMILYFDPTCEHCKAFITDLLSHESDFAKTQIVMISYTPVDQIKKFEAPGSVR